MGKDFMTLFFTLVMLVLLLWFNLIDWDHKMGLKWGLKIGGSNATHRNSRCHCSCPYTLAKQLHIVNHINDSSSTDVEDKKHRYIFFSCFGKNQTGCEDNNTKCLKSRFNKNLNKTAANLLSSRCKCKYQERSLIKIKTYVIVTIFAIFILIAYAGFLVCLHPMINSPECNSFTVPGGPSIPYRRQSNGTESDHSEYRWDPKQFSII